MAVVVTVDMSNFTTIHDFDTNPAALVSLGNTSKGNTLDTTNFVEATSAHPFRVSGAGVGGAVFDVTTAVSISGQHLYCYGRTLDNVKTIANGGWAIRVASSVDGLTNWGQWNVGGSDVVSYGLKGYFLFIVDTARPFDSTAGTPPALTSVQSFALIADHLTATSRETMFFDIWRRSTTPMVTVTATGTTAADPLTFAKIVDAINNTTNGSGILKSIGGTFYLAGKLKINAVAGVENFFFKSAGDVIVVEDLPFADDLCEIILAAGSTTGTVEYQFGEAVGSGAATIGINPTTINKLGLTQRVGLTIEDGGIDVLKLYALKVTGGGRIKLGTAGTALSGTNEIVDCDFTDCLQIFQRIAAVGRLLLRNKIVSNKDYRASLDSDGADQDTDAGAWQIVQGSCFVESVANAGAITLTVRDHAFSSANLPHLNITDANETWEAVNPSNLALEVTKQKQLDFSTAAATASGQIHADIINASQTSARQVVRASNGDLYSCVQTGTKLRMRKSTDNGATWTVAATGLDDAGAPAAVNNPSIAMDAAANTIHAIYASTTALAQHTTFSTANDTWAAVPTTVRNVAGSDIEACDIGVDSLGTAHVCFKDQGNDNFYYNNSIDFVNNEVLVYTTTTAVEGRAHLVIDSSDIPHCCAFIDDTVDEVRVFKGNARDAISFTDSGRLDTDFPHDIAPLASACITDDDVIVLVWLTAADDLIVARHVGTDVASGWTVTKIIDNQSAGSLSNPTIAALNNRVYIALVDLADDEVKFIESKNGGIGWDTAFRVVTTTTTSQNPKLRAQHNPKGGAKPTQLDLTYTSATPTLQHARINQTEVAGVVNVKFDVVTTVQEPSGTKLQNARVKIVENDNGAGAAALPDEGTTDVNGLVTLSYLASRNVPNGNDGITQTLHAGQALKAYKYGKLPFAGAQTIVKKLEPGVTLLVDSFQVDLVEATARLDGSTKPTISEAGVAAVAQHSLLKYTAGLNTLTIGSTVTGVTSGATGVVVDIIEGDSVAGTVVLDTRAVAAFTAGGEPLSGPAFWSATLTPSSEQRFHWLVKAGETTVGVKRTAQKLYDMFQAKLTESPLDTADLWDDVIIAGRAEFANPFVGVQVSPNKFETIRNVARAEGWIITGLPNLGFISGFTDNAGTKFLPSSVVILEVNNLQKNAKGEFPRVKITALAGGPEAVGTVLMLEEALEVDGAKFKATQAYNFTADQPVSVQARLKGFGKHETTDTITIAGLTNVAIWRPDKNVE